jgi:uncharacterized protein YcbX
VRGLVQSIWRYPVKGFTPEPLEAVSLAAGRYMPCDRLYAVEDGPSGFDPAHPVHMSKQKFTVLAKIAEVAKIRTRYDEASGVFSATAPGHSSIDADLVTEPGREALAAWLSEVLAGEISGPLKVLPASGAHRFTDDEDGFVSIINLASLAELERQVGRPVDPRRFRANFYVEGWPAWIENGLTDETLRIGETEMRMVKPIPRCIATHVDPDTGDKDIDVVRSLFEGFGHTLLGVYVRVLRGGRVRLGDAAIIDG